MLYPSINDLLDKVDSRYTLVVVAAKRARQIIDGSDLKVEPYSKKPVSIATQEIFEEKLDYYKKEDMAGEIEGMEKIEEDIEME